MRRRRLSAQHHASQHDGLSALQARILGSPRRGYALCHRLGACAVRNFKQASPTLPAAHLDGHCSGLLPCRSAINLFGNLARKPRAAHRWHAVTLSCLNLVRHHHSLAAYESRHRAGRSSHLRRPMHRLGFELCARAPGDSAPPHGAPGGFLHSGLHHHGAHVPPLFHTCERHGAGRPYRRTARHEPALVLTGRQCPLRDAHPAQGLFRLCHDVLKRQRHASNHRTGMHSSAGGCLRSARMQPRGARRALQGGNVMRTCRLPTGKPAHRLPDKHTCAIECDAARGV